MKRSTRLAATALATIGLTAGAATTASAVTMAAIPDESYAEVTVDNLISPYGKKATCQLQKGDLGYTPGTCKQQRPDGIWVQLEPIGAPFLSYMVYPVWDDPEAVSQALPLDLQKELEKWELIRAMIHQPGSDLLFSPRLMELALTPANQFPDALYAHSDEFMPRHGQ